MIAKIMDRKRISPSHMNSFYEELTAPTLRAILAVVALSREASDVEYWEIDNEFYRRLLESDLISNLTIGGALLNKVDGQIGIAKLYRNGKLFYQVEPNSNKS